MNGSSCAAELIVRRDDRLADRSRDRIQRFLPARSPLNVQPPFAASGHASSVALLLAILSVLALVLLGKVPGEGRWATDLANFAHGPALAAVTLAMFGLIRRTTARHATVHRQFLAAVTVALLLGALVELLQLLSGRDASIADLRRDALGIMAAAGFFAVLDRRVRFLPGSEMLRTAGILVSVVCSALLVAPLLLTAAAYLERNRSFPVLVDFSSPHGTYFLSMHGAVWDKLSTLPIAVTGDAPPTVGLHVKITDSDKWGLAIWEPKPDWRAYNFLKLDIINPTDDRLVLGVRIRDRHPRHDRHQRDVGTIEIPPHARETAALVLPRATATELDLAVDLEGVRAIVLTRNPDNRAKTFYIVKVWLDDRSN